ncbi:MAG: AbrB/MazE/SpoVT family DNA-binding domain-containing protein [Acidobacteriota bacterium]
MTRATITSKGQVTLPKDLRERMSWKTGDRLDFALDASGRVTVELAGGDIRDVRGLLAREGPPPVSVEELNRGIERHVVEKYLRGSKSKT